MSKKIWGIVVAVMVIVVGGYLVLNEKGEKADTSADFTKEEQPAKKMAFNEFVKKGGSYKCEVKQYLSDMDNSGTVYIDGDRIRGDFSTIAEGKIMETSFILRDGNSYTWSSALPTMGFIVKIQSEGEGDGSGNLNGTYSWNAEQIGDYDCQPWTPDPNMFALPRGVTFSEINPK